MIKFFKNLFNLNKIVDKQQETIDNLNKIITKQQSIIKNINDIEGLLAILENKFNKITTK